MDAKIRVLGPKISRSDFSDEAILQLHRRIEWRWPAVILLVSLLAAVLLPDLGRSVSDSLMPTVAEILALLFLAQIVEIGFRATRLGEQIDAEHSGLLQRYLRETARVDFVVFLAGEAAALYATAKEPTTFLVVLAVLVGVSQARDLSFAVHIRSGGRLSLPTMIERQSDRGSKL